MLKKRGQAETKIIIIAISALIILLGAFYLFNSVANSMHKFSCRYELDSLKSGLVNSVSNIGHGSTEDLNTSGLCNAEKVYFIDLKKAKENKEALSRSLYEYPAIVDYIESGVKKNVFLVKNNKVFESFYAGNIYLEKPFFVCSDTTKAGTHNEKLSIYLDGKGNSAQVRNAACMFDCTFDIVDLEDAGLIIDKAKDKGWLEPGDYGQIHEDTQQAVKIARRCNCGRKEGETIVEVKITPEQGAKVTNFRLIESINKSPGTEEIDLDFDLEEMEGDYADFKINPDPEMMFSFESITGETVISYVINKNIPGYCGEYIQSVGLGVVADSPSERDAAEDLLSSAILADEPASSISFDIPDLTIEDGNARSEYEIWRYLSSEDFTPDRKKGFGYEISFVSGNPDVSCEIQEMDIVCSAPAGFFAPATFRVEVNTEPIQTDTFTVSQGSSVTPTVTAAANPTSVEVNNPVLFTCTASNIPSPTYSWDFDGDGTEDSTAQNPSYHYSSTGTYTATCTVGAYSDSVDVTVNPVAVVCSDYNTNQIGCTTAGCEWCPKCDGKKWNGQTADGCVDSGTCTSPYQCNYGECGAECDSNNNCDMSACNGCNGGVMRLYAPASCLSDCSCPLCTADFLTYTAMDTDVDGDGYNIECEGDCNDANFHEHPGQTWYKDFDYDTYSDGTTTTQCSRPSGYKVSTELTQTSGDCNDENTNIKPGATERCDGVDNDCNAGTADGSGETYYQSPETICNDGNDNDCDGAIDCADSNCDELTCGIDKVCRTGTCEYYPFDYESGTYTALSLFNEIKDKLDSEDTWNSDDGDGACDNTCVFYKDNIIPTQIRDHPTTTTSQIQSNLNTLKGYVDTAFGPAPLGSNNPEKKTYFKNALDHILCILDTSYC